ncbi:MAG: NAD-binding protein [Isosphaeraceae bacterium]
MNPPYRAKAPRWLRPWLRRVGQWLKRWNRHQISRIVASVFASWVLGAVLIHLAEGSSNPDFATWTDSFWNVWVLLFSGLDTPPKTVAGRLLTMALLVLGVGLASLFTASLASILIEHYLNRGRMPTFEMENHLVLCNWSPRGVGWIREVHAKIVQEKRPVVIIHDNPDDIELPDRQDEAAFADVYIINGDPTMETALYRARVPQAHSVVVLTDEREGHYADGKSILICIAIRNICRGESQPSVAAECSNPANLRHLRKAGADEVISSAELGLRLLARTALYHGMTRVYQELLTVGRDANEMYLLPAPEEFIGKDFVDIAGRFLRDRADKRSCLLLGIQRDEEMMLNPIGHEAGPLREGDQLIVMSRVFHESAQVPPAAAEDLGDRSQS